MKLNKNSISSKLYRWFYCTDEMPISLCPYFWKLVLAWLFLIPLSVVRLPSPVFSTHDNTISGKIALGLLGWFGVFLIFSLLSPVALFFTSFEKGFMMTTISRAISVWIIGILVLLYLGIVRLKEHISDKKRSKMKRNEYGRIIIPDKKPNIVKEFVKAKYNKYCPKIEWINSDNK